MRSLARLYGRLREAFGWKNREIDELTMGEVEEIVEHWREEPPMAEVIRAHFPVKTGGGERRATRVDPPVVAIESLNDAEYAAREAEMRQFVARHGKAGP